jgi:hypothetical protein
VYLASADLGGKPSSIPKFLRALETQRAPQRHSVTDSLDDADAILFTECHLLNDWRLRAITSAEPVRRYPEKSFVYDERDNPWCGLPGIYVSMPARSFDAHRQVAGAYVFQDDPASRLDYDPSTIDPDLLFSFVGSMTHSIRDDILKLKYVPNSLVERIDGFMFYDSSSVNFETRRVHFAEALFRSQFVLCPRGWGTSSIRLYETMSAGRAPVIISDQWVAPRGPNWSDFSIRWPESKIAELPSYLASINGQAAAMGRRAREAYDAWFATDIKLTRQIDALAEKIRREPRRRFGARRSDQEYWRLALRDTKVEIRRHISR